MTETTKNTTVTLNNQEVELAETPAITLGSHIHSSIALLDYETIENRVVANVVSAVEQQLNELLYSVKQNYLKSLAFTPYDSLLQIETDFERVKDKIRDLKSGYGMGGGTIGKMKDFSTAYGGYGKGQQENLYQTTLRAMVYDDDGGSYAAATREVSPGPVDSYEKIMTETPAWMGWDTADKDSTYQYRVIAEPRLRKGLGLPGEYNFVEREPYLLADFQTVSRVHRESKPLTNPYYNSAAGTLEDLERIIKNTPGYLGHTMEVDYIQNSVYFALTLSVFYPLDQTYTEVLARLHQASPAGVDISLSVTQTSNPVPKPKKRGFR